MRIPSSHPPRPLIAFFVALFAAAAYSPVWNAGWIWDDDAYVVNNPTLSSSGGLSDIWLDPAATPQYYPMVHTSFWIEHRFWGLHPRGFHLVNVLLHATNAILLILLLARVGIRGASAAGILFALHPVMTESVAWVTERKNTLSLFFYLLSFMTLASHLGLLRPRRAATGILYAISLALFLCALLSKSVTCSLPAAAALAVWWRRGELSRRDSLSLLPFFAIGIVSASVTVWLEKHHVGAAGQDWSLSIFDRMMIAARAPWFYLGKVLWPGPLAFIYPRWGAGDWRAWEFMFIPAALLLGALLYLRGRTHGRGTVALLLYFGGTLVPALGFFDVFPFRYSFVADHFQYHASLGLIAGMGWLAAAIRARARAFRSEAVGCAVALAALTLGLFSQSRIYKDQEVLWTDTLRKNPASAIAHNNLGTHLASLGRMDAAARAFEAGFKAAPDDTDLRVNLAAAYVELGRAGEAAALAREALKTGETNPWLWNTLGLALQKTGRIDEALDAFQRAVGQKPDMAEAWNNLAAAMAATGRAAAAADILRMGLRNSPGHPLLVENLRRLETMNSEAARR